MRIRERIGSICGLVGPVAFTAAWLEAARRQGSYEVRHEHISGLAAKDAEAAWLMTAGFLTLGACTVAFAWALDRRLSPDPGVGPALLGTAGVATLAAGAFRRDRRSNVPLPGEGGPLVQSLENDVHDTAAVAVAVSGTAGLLALATRLAREPGLRSLARGAVAAAVTSLGLSAWFLRDVMRPWNGVVQRVSVTVPLGFMGLLAAWLLRERHALRRAPGRSP